MQVLTLPDGNPRVVATHPPGEYGAGGVDPQGTEALVVRGQMIGRRSLDGANRLRVLGQTRDAPWDIAYSPRGDLAASTDSSAETRIWSTVEGARNPVRILQVPGQPGRGTLFDPQGRRVSQGGANGTQVLWDLEDVPDAKPLVVGRPGPSLSRSVTWDPDGRWLVAGAVGLRTLEFWPVSGPRRRVLPGVATSFSVAFTPDGRWLAHCVLDRQVRLWPLNASDGTVYDLVLPETCVSLAMHPADGRVLVDTTMGPNGSKVILGAIPAGPSRVLADRFWHFASLAFDRAGRRVVVAPMSLFGPLADPAQRVLRVWDLSSGEERVYSVAHVTDANWRGFFGVAFGRDGLYVGGPGGVRRLTLPADPGGTVTSETVYESPLAGMDLSRDQARLLVLGARGPSGFGTPLFDEMLLLDLAGHTSRRITTHGARLSRGFLSPSGRAIVTGDHDGVVRVGPVSGGEPHLLLGHRGPITALAISPDERWIASVSDESISIWPMPDVSKPPLHTLPHAELLAKLDALTNLRVVRDAASSTGWKLDVGPFGGWKDVPEW